MKSAGCIDYYYVIKVTLCMFYRVQRNLNGFALPCSYTGISSFSPNLKLLNRRGAVYIASHHEGRFAILLFQVSGKLSRHRRLSRSLQTRH